MNAKYYDLVGKKILVTGASSGIGREVASFLSMQGCELYISGRNQERLNETNQLLAVSGEILPCDLACESERNNLVDVLPALDGICHAAGIINPFPLSFINEKEFDKVFNINAKAPILLTSALLRRKKLNKNASIVFISSIASDRAMKGGTTYSISKAAIEAFSRHVSIEHASTNIRSNCLRPGLTKTSIFEQADALSVAIGAKNWLDDYNKLYPSGIGEASDIAAAALFLLSNSSRWITGTEITLDGGTTNIV